MMVRRLEQHVPYGHHRRVEPEVPTYIPNAQRTLRIAAVGVRLLAKVMCTERLPPLAPYDRPRLVRRLDLIVEENDEIVVHLLVVRCNLKRPTHVRLRLIRPPEVHEDAPEQMVRGGRGGRDRGQTPDRCLRLCPAVVHAYPLHDLQ